LDELAVSGVWEAAKSPASSASLETLSQACSRRSWPSTRRTSARVDAISIGVDRMQRNFGPLAAQIRSAAIGPFRSWPSWSRQRRHVPCRRNTARAACDPRTTTLAPRVVSQPNLVLTSTPRICPSSLKEDGQTGIPRICASPVE